MTMVAVAPLWEERTGDEPTLAEVIGVAWEALAAGRAAECPVCHGEMVPSYGATRPLSGLCGSCGSRLS
jgi:hypothetical protein